MTSRVTTTKQNNVNDEHLAGPRKDTPHLRRNIKDDVFCDLFSRKEYLLELYRDLHPEDTKTTEQDLELVTIERIVTSGQYNDLGFVANGRLVVLVEAQSTWSPNIATRMFFYLAETYREMTHKVRQKLYGIKLVELPTPELYVIYTGKREVPDRICFKRDVLQSDKGDFDLTIHVITEGQGIAGQYVEFAKRADEISESNADPTIKVKTLLDECISQGILKTYLESRYKEVGDIMFWLFDQEAITREYEQELKDTAKAEGMAEGKAEGMAEGKAEGKAEGMAEGEAKGSLNTIIDNAKSLMKKMNLSTDEAMDLLDVPIDMRETVAKQITA